MNKLQGDSKLVKEATGKIIEVLFDKPCYELGDNSFKNVCNEIYRGEKAYEDYSDGFDLFFLSAYSDLILNEQDPEKLDIGRNYLFKLAKKLKNDHQ